jgi:hypothetical protein
LREIPDEENEETESDRDKDPAPKYDPKDGNNITEVGKVVKLKEEASR